ncbi:hypothetical protein BDZ97DRAFT_2053638 [Flammula alnicola]|nr:hypothetical protein BDZ97DRAFT_2053638 [Flammula alnicola]
MNMDITVNPSLLQSDAVRTGSQLNNQALAATRNGDLATAERLNLEAIATKERGLGLDHPTTALSYNALGELYLKQKRLDEAENYLMKAVAIRNVKGAAFDAAVSRENLAQLQELRGDLVKAKEIRLTGFIHHSAGLLSARQTPKRRFSTVLSSSKVQNSYYPHIKYRAHKVAFNF